MPKKKKTLVILASGNGSNAENIIRHIQRGRINAKIAFVFSDNRKAKVLARAKRLKVPYISFDPKEFQSRKKYHETLIQLMKREKVDCIALAGYMRILADDFVKKFKHKLINIHPSLLPAFKGVNSIQRAYDYGVRVSGATVHFVIPEIDSGPIILQKEVVLRNGESLSSFEKRIHQAEYEIFPKALKIICEGKYQIKGNKVKIKN